MPAEKPFNGLTPAEAERLDMLAEEAAEVILAVSKIKRHGYNSTHPNNANRHRHNRTDLEKEIGDFIGIMRTMFQRGDVDFSNIDRAASVKWRNALPYTHHQGND
ncbi:hypothetical protein [Mesorhizobium sp. Cs1299R1N3]|uniref:hypothetical protein n=1 Tax=Mesorhizobium sp. Cs1299R1N3 TaxID=3015173 RepID=UPI00301D7A56